jgi:hypothetical protein
MLKETAMSVVAANNSQALVIGEAVGLERVEEAKELGITPGKLNLIEKLIESSEDPESVTKEDWLDKSVKEIMEQTKENTDKGQENKPSETPGQENRPSETPARKTNHLKHQARRTDHLRHQARRTNHLKHQARRTDHLRRQARKTNHLKHQARRTDHLRHQARRTGHLKHQARRTDLLRLQVRRTGHLKHQARTRSQTLTMVMDEDKTNIQSQTSFIITEQIPLFCFFIVFQAMCKVILKNVDFSRLSEDE